ncbi:CHAT domain-containing protein [Amycolatopsis sp. NBC_00355]|uniref:CHAT domain-containing protein n=1 Tax=Amycolatopsis sp. NBC_00355 TaxID=2975957 RepID=UPI002E2712F1
MPTESTEDRMSVAEIHHRADVLAELVERDPHATDPGGTGPIGYLLLDSLDETEPGFATDLDTAILLLRHGVAFAADDDLACSWRMALAVGYAHRAGTGDATQWTAALYWGEQAVATANDADELAEAVLQVAEIRAGRLGARWDDEHVSAETRRYELDGELAVFSELAEQLAEPADRALLDLHRGRILGARHDFSAEDADLRRAIELVDDALGRLPAGHPALPEGMSLLADLHRERYRKGEDPDDLHTALALATAAVEATSHDDPVRPERHLQLARLVLIRRRKAAESDPDDLDRIIDGLAVAVEADVDPDVRMWYGEALLERGQESGSVADLTAATEWLARGAAAQDPAEEDAWYVWSQLAETHSELFERTGDQRHADAVLEAVASGLELPVPDPDLTYEFHTRRLDAAFQDGKRPDLRELVARYPVVEWVRQAHAAVDDAVAAGQLSEMAALLSYKVGMSWYYLVVRTSDHGTADLAEFRTLISSMSPLFRNALGLLDLPPEHQLLLETLVEFYDNVTRIVAGDGDADFSTLQRAFTEPELSDVRTGLRDIMNGLLPLVGSITGSLSAMDAGLALFAAVRDDEAANPGRRAEATAMHRFYEVLRAIHTRTDQREIHELARSACDLLRALPPEPALDPILDMIEMLTRVGAVAFATEPLPARSSAHAEAWLGKLLEPMSVGSEVIAAVNTKDLRALRQICDRLSTMAVPVDGEESIPFHGVRAVAYENLFLLDPGNGEALETAIDAYRRCFAEIDMDSSPLLAEQSTSLAAALRRRGRPEDFTESRRLARKVVENAAWRVLIQSESEHAMEIARTSMDAADQLTAWCVEDDAVAELVQIVDARRSLVLRSANTTRSVSAQLGTLGEDLLALEWEAAGGADEPLATEHGGPGIGWGALRRKVLRVLAKDSEDLLSPPTVEEIQHALRAQGSDVLAYLLPANAHHGAVAVLVPAQGAPVARPLPELGEAEAVKRYQEAYAAWDTADHPAGPEYQRWVTELHEVCRWAWDAAAAELLDYAGRDTRFVLVPLGVLGLVPWHAAYRPVDGHDRHFVQDATVSYVPSGRLFCEAVARPDVRGDDALLVGNPAGDLPDGAAEAVAIRDSCYPGGVFLGGTGRTRWWIPASAGPGTPEQVRDHLRGPLDVLHLACHAFADVRSPLRSRIELAGGALSARDLLELSPARPLELALVVLAGCTTQVSGVDYDEALSLSATFLAIGARTVVGSLWRVPAGWSTATLMWLFHENVRRHGLTPAEALRQAQLTLLEQSAPLDGIPDALLELRPAGSGTIGIESWAGFSPQGR